MRFDFPKTELHLHLDGSFRPDTMWELAMERNVPMPVATKEAYRLYSVVPSDTKDVNEYLERFDVPTAVLQDKESLGRITEELVETLLNEQVVYAEIRFAPQLHTKKGLRQSDTVEAVLSAVQKASAGKPITIGIILCTLCQGPETVNMEANLETVRVTKRYLGRGVVATDLAGAEGIVPLRNFSPIFELAKELGVPFTCHAGDSQGPETVADALSFGTKRIGHGHHIYDDEALLQRAIDLKVTLEICPTSNVQCKSQPSYRAHPAKKLFDRGLSVTINTDNRAMSGVTLLDEYRHCVEEMGFTEKDLYEMNRMAIRCAFLPEEEKERLLRMFKEETE